MNLPPGANEYYEHVPPITHQPGDIWNGLPTFGVLPQAHTAAIVITPSCDFAQQKVETVTYLPVVSVREYLSSRSRLELVVDAVDGQLQAAGMPGGTKKPGALVPALTDLREFELLLRERAASPMTGKKEIAACDRASAGIRVLLGQLSGTSGTERTADLKLLLGEKVFARTLERIVRNSDADTHFLPPDEQHPAFSLVREPSVALFRYPQSLPVDILNLAATVSENAWIHSISEMRDQYPCVAAFKTRPMKHLRLQPRFLADLLSRFVRLYIRLGSPDFSDFTVAGFIRTLGGEA
jgi:hypothetical protein